MTHNQLNESHDPVQQAYDTGRRSGLAIGAFATSLVAFINLLGIEKALLALALAILAIRGTRPGTGARRLAASAIMISSVYAVTFVTFLILYRTQLANLLHLLQQLG